MVFLISSMGIGLCNHIEHNMNLKIHRGTHEIGGTCVEVSAGKTRILVDLGMPLVSPKDKKQKLDTSAFKKLKAKDLLEMGVLPNVPGLYDEHEPCSIDAILLSHPHQDHYGLLGYVRKDIPVYIGEPAKRIIDASDIFLPGKTFLTNTRPIKPGKTFLIGEFRISAYLMDHSSFDSLCFLIEAEGKKVFYSGDFRAHGRKAGLFDALVKNPPRDIDVLLMEGTVLGSSSHGSLTEDQIEDKIVEAAKKYTGVKLVSASGQNIDRIVSFYRAAIRTQSILVVDLYMAYILDSLRWPTIPHPSANFPLLKILYTQPMAKKLANAGKKECLYKWNRFKIKPAEIGKNPGKAFVFYRNSLSQYIKGIKNFSDAVMIYSMYSGYMEEPSYRWTSEFLDKYGIKTEKIHTSGHASPAHLKQFVSALAPKTLIPIHTFAPEAFKNIYPSVKILEDGEAFTV